MQSSYGDLSTLNNEVAPTNVILLPPYKKNNVLLRPGTVKLKDIAKIWSDILCPEQFQCAQRLCKSVREDEYDDEYNDSD